METKHIQDFIELANLGSSYAAAEKLFVSQSTLVRHIQSFEEEFGVTLFDRTRTGFVLNEAGKIFLPYARKIALAQKQCYMELHHEEEDSKLIRICARHKIVDLMLEFKKEYPEYIIEYKDSNHADGLLREGLLDVAFICDVDDPDEDLIQIPYIKERMLLLVSASHPLAARNAVSLEEIRDEEFISLASDLVFEEAFMEDYSKADFTPHVTVTVPVGQDVIEMVRAKIGIAIMHGVPNMLPEREGVKIVDIVPHVNYCINLCYRNTTHLSVGTKKFIEFVQKRKVKHQNTNRTFL